MVYCIGETVLDIIFKDEQPVAAKPGGAMLNTAVSLGRAGIPVSLLTEFGIDRPGELIRNFLLENKVSTEFTYQYSDGRTAISMAFLTDKNEAEYTFYKRYPEKRFLIPIPVFKPGDFVLYGSYFAIAHEIRESLLRILNAAREAGASLIYDPNFRKAHLEERDELIMNIRENMALAGLIRGSHEDFLNTFAARTGEEAFREVSDTGCSRLIYTSHHEGVEVFDGKDHFSFPVPEIEPVSTIGAGDAFNAGVIYSLLKKDLRNTDPAGLEEESWREIAETGVRFATDVCMSMDNYISEPFVKKLIK